mmetsp:Transcript_497/g.1604  ORF Transcript_497/g.1604 Transcript_497/m.1604 type:complete len:377 (+) Transcript_497:742-1872(+)
MANACACCWSRAAVRRPMRSVARESSSCMSSIRRLTPAFSCVSREAVANAWSLAWITAVYGVHIRRLLGSKLQAPHAGMWYSTLFFRQKKQHWSLDAWVIEPPTGRTRWAAFTCRPTRLGCRDLSTSGDSNLSKPGTGCLESSKAAQPLPGTTASPKMGGWRTGGRSVERSTAASRSTRICSRRVFFRKSSWTWGYERHNCRMKARSSVQRTTAPPKTPKSMRPVAANRTYPSECVATRTQSSGMRVVPHRTTSAATAFTTSHRSCRVTTRRNAENPKVCMKSAHNAVWCLSLAGSPRRPACKSCTTSARPVHPRPGAQALKSPQRTRPLTRKPFLFRSWVDAASGSALTCTEELVVAASAASVGEEEEDEAKGCG